jgi:polyhydroxybutyrate depolymerase
MPDTNGMIKKLPLIIVLHGHGGNGKQIMKSSGFNEISDKEKFLVVYPDGMNKGWNDGRESNGNEKYDDIKFISLLIDKINSEYNIDSARIFATGISNGGIFSLYLAHKLSKRILAIAPIAANIPENLVKNYKLDYPVSLMLINGTSDPLIKYDGGKVGFKIGKNRGWTISTDSTIMIFKALDKCNDAPKVSEIPDINEDDDCNAIKYEYEGGSMNTNVVLIKILNGGHTFPGGTQYLPKFLVGNVCRDFNAADLIWEFFKSRKTR